MAISMQDSLNALGAYQSSTYYADDDTSTPVVDEEVWDYNPRYNTYDNYTDDNYVIIDDQKNIGTVTNQVNIVQENNSQYIPFKVKRYWDGIDLMNEGLNITVYYVIPSSGDYAEAAGQQTVVNCKYTKDTVTFGWLLDSKVTSRVGDVKFQIFATGTRTKNNEGYYNNAPESYTWCTMPNGRLTIYDSLSANYEDAKPENFDTWYSNFANQMTQQVNQANASRVAAEAAVTTINSKIETLDKNVDEKITEAVKDITSLKNLAVSYDQETNTMEFWDMSVDKECTDESRIAKIDNLDGVSNLKINYEAIVDDEDPTVSKYKLSFYDAIEDEDHVIDEIELDYTPTGAWRAALISDVNGLIDTAKAEVQTNVDALSEKVDAFKSFEKIIVTELPTSDIREDAVYMLTLPEDEQSNNHKYTCYTYVTEDDGSSHWEIIGSAMDKDNYYTKEEVDDKLATTITSDKIDAIIEKNATINSMQEEINTNTASSSSLQSQVEAINKTLSSLNTDQKYRYEITYGENEHGGVETDTEDQATHRLTLWEITDKDMATETYTAAGSFVVSGGGGSATTSTIIISRTEDCPSPYIVLNGKDVVIKFNFSSKDTSGEAVDAKGKWSIGNTVIGNTTLYQGLNEFDVTKYVSTGTQKVTLVATDENGTVASRSWQIQIVDVNLASTFDDTIPRKRGTVPFTYVPYGSISKTVHIKYDSEELDTVTTTSSGTAMTYTLPEKDYGSYLVETWITATVGNVEIETAHVYKDIIIYDSDCTVPVIGCATQTISTKQYAQNNIVYTVYDASNETPTVVLAEDGNVLSTLNVTSNTNTWQYRSSTVGSHVLTITCGSTVKTINVEVAEIGVDISSVTEGLVFDFDPVGKSNSSEDDKAWSYEDTSINLTVSDNFDWNNGGYQIDSTTGDQYFCVKAGTRATINYDMFADSATVDGKEFKVIFKVTNVQKADATFLECQSGTPRKIGLEMDVHNAWIRSSVDDLFSPYSEDDVIEFDFNIAGSGDEIPLVMTYEDGVASRPKVYASGTNYTQTSPVPITIGSDDCDVYIYRMKLYNRSLSDKLILRNFIADARTADEMIDRYERNQIYDENGNLTPESVAKACPDLRIIKIECPHFTNSKKDYVKNTKVECIYTNGDPTLDNWVWENVYHAGQGTTSDAYGASARNIDIICCADGKNQIISKIPLDTSYISKLTLGDGTVYDDGTGKVSLSRTSIPNNWYNLKLNVASSDNANNALLQKRFNTYLPYTTLAMQRQEYLDAGVTPKNTMEFFNCVVFVKETDEDPDSHREFGDNEYHFYGIGNIGDSKKTDATRANDPEDIKEYTIEVSDNTLPNSCFETGYTNSDGSIRYPITKEEWSGTDGYEAVTDSTLLIAENLPIFYEKSGSEYTLTTDTAIDSSKTYYMVKYKSSAYKNLYVDIYKSSSGKVNQISGWGATFEWRYDMGGETKDGITSVTSEEKEAQRVKNIQKFRDFYEFVVTSSDDEFNSKLKDWFIEDAALYFYLFTERYTMIDNRAKNVFYHYGKCTDGEYRFELWDYDNDTGLGINNSGEAVFPYGLEDVDTSYTKPNGEVVSGPVFNAYNNVFWCRVRDVMRSKLQTMYIQEESNLDGAWSANSLIKQFDAWQEQFPEELWRLDIQRKYIRPYLGTKKNDNTTYYYEPTERYLTEMMNGRKKYQRRQYERDQERYIATKYLGASVQKSQIMFRCNTPTDAVVLPDYTLHLTPYSDMYLDVAFGNSAPQQVRAKSGQTYDIVCPLDSMNDTAVLIYCGEGLQSVGDLSKLYIHDNDFGNATHLTDLIIGSDVEGYSNPYLTTLSMGSNTLLRKLDVRNTPNLTGTLDLSKCGNLRELYASGSAISALTIATNGMAETIKIPAISSLTLKQLYYLNDLTISSYDNLTTLVVDSCSTVDALTIVKNAPHLTRVRLTNVNWTLDDTTVLESLYAMKGLDNNNGLTEHSVLTGSIHVKTMRQSELNKYKELWGDKLTLTYDYFIQQYTVSFYNAVDASGEKKLLLQEIYDTGAIPDDPTKRSENPLKPTLESTIDTVYTFNKWDTAFTAVAGNQVYTAVYTTTPRTYTVTFKNKDGNVLQTTTDVPYGGYVDYTGTSGTYVAPTEGTTTESSDGIERAAARQALIPTYTFGESSNVFNLFKGWDLSGYVNGYVNGVSGEIGDKVITAEYDTMTYATSGNSNSFTHDVNGTPTYKSFGEYSPLEIYTMLQLNKTGALHLNDGDSDNNDGDIVGIGDSISIEFGSDVTYKDIDSHEYVSRSAPLVLNGSNYLDTAVDANHKDYSQLMNIDKDFVLAIEYYIDNTSASNAVLMQCFNPQQANGIKIDTSAGVLVNYYGSSQSNITSKASRELLVLRHKKGSKTLHIYSANTANVNPGYYALKNTKTSVDAVTSGLVFGCAKNDANTSNPYSAYVTGTIYWAKVWMADLGDTECKRLTSWTHNSMSFSVAKYGAYYSKAGSTVNFTLLADHLLPKNKVMGNCRYPESTLNTYLNARVFSAFPTQWQAIMQQTQIASWYGPEQKTLEHGTIQYVPSETYTTMYPFVFIPCLYDINASSNDYFNKEGGEDATIRKTIPFISTAASMVKYYSDRTSTPGNWWLRTISYDNPDMMYSVIWSESSTGAVTAVTNGYTSSSESYAVLIMISI